MIEVGQVRFTEASNEWKHGGCLQQSSIKPPDNRAKYDSDNTHCDMMATVEGTVDTKLMNYY